VQIFTQSPVLSGFQAKVSRSMQTGTLIAACSKKGVKMKNSLYDQKHWREYLTYGSLAALAFIIPQFVFFLYKDYNLTALIFFGCIFFMFVIMLYAWKLSKRRPEYKSTWMMIIASHFAILVGIIQAVVLTTILCFIFIPGFLSGGSRNVLDDAPTGLNPHNSSLLVTLYLCATLLNFGAAGFMAVLGPYVFKINQTKDKTALLDPHISRS
jgi:hypothetical protein